jgi:cytochrome c oxidase assembly protein subunit 15
MNSTNKDYKLFMRLVLIGLLLTIVVIGLGAYARLTDAGLGCPDWPTCYGLINVPQTASQIAVAEQVFPERPVEPVKAWNEMIHRYFAGALGILIAVIALISIKARISRKQTVKMPLLLPLIILAVVTFQAALGMWTVTLKLMPIVVMGHLLGGFTTLCLLFLLYLRLKVIHKVKSSPQVLSHQSTSQKVSKGATNKYISFGLIGIVILTAQIALGGWTSSNYAAMSCVEFPICQGDWRANLTFDKSFDIVPPKKDSYEFGYLAHDERMTIHVTHRLGAIITALFIAWLAVVIFIRSHGSDIKKSALLMFTLLLIQLGLGISNIWFSLPLSVAVAHNVVAALLMLSLIALTYKLKQNARELTYE